MHIFGAGKHFFLKILEEGSKSTKYTNIKSEYIGILDKIKLLESRIMDYNMMNLFNIPTLVDEYFGAVEDRWVNRATTGFYLLSH